MRGGCFPCAGPCLAGSHRAAEPPLRACFPISPLDAPVREENASRCSLQSCRRPVEHRAGCSDADRGGWGWHSRRPLPHQQSFLAAGGCWAGREGGPPGRMLAGSALQRRQRATEPRVWLPFWGGRCTCCPDKAPAAPPGSRAELGVTPLVEAPVRVPICRVNHASTRGSNSHFMTRECPGPWCWRALGPRLRLSPWGGASALALVLGSAEGSCAPTAVSARVRPPAAVAQEAGVSAHRALHLPRRL